MQLKSNPFIVYKVSSIKCLFFTDVGRVLLACVKFSDELLQWQSKKHRSRGNMRYCTLKK